MALTITKPTVNGSSGTWGQILNDALDAVVSQVNTNLTNITTLQTSVSTNAGDITSLKTRVTTLETASGGSGTARGQVVANATSVATQAVADGSQVAVNFTNVISDTLNAMGTTTRYTCKLAGVYEFTGGVSFASTSSTTGYRTAYWTLNGSAVSGGTVQVGPISGVPCAIPARTIVLTLAVNDYVQLYAQQLSGASVNTQATSGGQYNPHINVKYQGAS